MRKTPYANDSRLWSYLVDEFRRAGADAVAADRHARRAVAVVRRERQPGCGVASWAPGDQIPAAVIWVYDLDGDVWVRALGGRWKMTGFDPEDAEIAASYEYDDAGLLDRYGPVTGTT